MVKRLTKFLVIIVIALMLIVPKAFAFSISDSEYVVNSYEQGFFCMNHGLILNYGTRFHVYERGPISSLGSSFQHSTHAGLDGAGDNGQLLSFIVGDMAEAALTDGGINGNLPPGGRSNQEWALYVWYLLDPVQYTTVSPSEFANLENKYNAYIGIYNQVMGANASTAVTITPPNPDIVVPNSNKLIGPFTITYPYDTTISNFIDYKINLDGTILYDETTNKLLRADGTQFQIGDTEFYVSESDVTYGKLSKFHVDWTFKYYTNGQYAKLTPIREVYYEYICNDCRATIRTTESGYIVGNTWTPTTRESFNQNSSITSVHDRGWTHSSPWSLDSFEDGNNYVPWEVHDVAGLYNRKVCSQTL